MASLGTCSTSLTFFMLKIDLVKWLLYLKTPVNMTFASEKILKGNLLIPFPSIGSSDIPSMT